MSAGVLPAIVFGASLRERLVVWAIGLLVIAASLGVGYLGTPYTADQAELEAVESNPAVELSALSGGYVIAPSEGAAGDDSMADTGMVFYPGARVHPNAYLPMLAPLVAETGITVYVPKAPLNLAVFDSDMAGPIIDAHPTVDRWVIAGHSLGGAMACRFAAANPDRVSALVLLGSYCDRDLGGTGLRVLSIQGGVDTVVDRATYERNRGYLPAEDTVEVTVDGMNHTQFGSYSGQRGDSPGTISYEAAHERLREELIDFLAEPGAAALAGKAS